VMKKFDRAGRWPVNKASRSVNPPGMSEQGYNSEKSMYVDGVSGLSGIMIYE
jgi:hypothetical protein